MHDKDRLTIDVFYQASNTPFITGVYGPCCVELLQEIEEQLREPDSGLYREGDGTYRFKVRYIEAQIDQYGRFECTDYYDLEFVQFHPHVCTACGGSGVVTFNPNLNPNEFPGTATAKCGRCAGTGLEP